MSPIHIVIVEVDGHSIGEIARLGASKREAAVLSTPATWNKREVPVRQLFPIATAGFSHGQRRVLPEPQLHFGDLGACLSELLEDTNSVEGDILGWGGEPQTSTWGDGDSPTLVLCHGRTNLEKVGSKRTYDRLSVSKRCMVFG